MKNNDINDYNRGKAIANSITKLMMTTESQSISDYKELEEWLKTNEMSREVIEKLSDEDALVNICDNHRGVERVVGRERLVDSIIGRKPKAKRFRLYKTVTSIAVAMLTVSFLLWYGVDNEPKQVSTTVTSINALTLFESNPVKPTLILSSGENIEIEDQHLNYKDDQKQSLLKKCIPEYNVLIVPKKHNYNFMLADGTKVYLNSDSELRYPTEFIGEKREVFLKGEAYFEVEKGVKPFIVNIDNVDIRVYGTKFNIKAYSTEHIETVLIEGSVGVSIDNKNEVKLVPNEYIMVDAINKCSTKKNVDVNLYTSWMDGYMKCDKESLRNVLDDLERNFDTIFTFSNEELSQIKLSGVINKKLSLDVIIEMIESSLNVKFIKQERGYNIE